MSNEAIVRLFVRACIFFLTVLFPRLDVPAGSFLTDWRGWEWPMHWGVFSSLPGHFSLDVSITPLPSLL